MSVAHYPCAFGEVKLTPIQASEAHSFKFAPLSSVKLRKHFTRNGGLPEAKVVRGAVPNSGNHSRRGDRCIKLEEVTPIWR